MAKLLKIHPAQEVEVPFVEVVDHHIHNNDTPFLSFRTIQILVGGTNGTVLMTKLDVEELEKNVYLRNTWMRESVCGYLSGRAELINVSKSRLVLSPSLIQHLGDRKSIYIIDEILINECSHTTLHIQAVLNKLREEFASELLISLEWTSYMEFVSDAAPHPVVYAERCGFMHTGLMWISKTL